MAESDHQIKYRKDVNERQEDWPIKTLRGRAIVPLIERTTQLLSSAQVPKPFGLEQTETTNHIFR